MNTHNQHALSKRMRLSDAEIGSILPFVAIFMLVGAVAIWGIASVGSLLIDRAQARTAADAAALAAALGTDNDARSIAVSNGATLVWIERFGNEVEVKVQLGRAHARARAKSYLEYEPPRYQPAWVP